ncbi:hypothetical protein FNV43_RR09665 [Rhamnella rubrinervis]|uniref:DNA 3'-5' helicase n=1 Tax=Rhamnella rubrinervis TaxID=2594499 RepID=A0A8K0HAV4_9ROSA|nr:hypothetical protein FNV43_RR09665 [Rhamnella rubrinervis]
MVAKETVLEELLNVEFEIQDVEEQIKMLLERQETLYERKSELKALLEASKGSGDPAENSASTTAENWSGSFEWDSEADDVRFNVFGILSYRANQREIINAVMSGKDVMVIMAAGGGKSLCYQLPAILRDGVASSLVMGLTALGIPAYMLTSTTSKEEEKFLYRALEKGKEAHCCSQWGHDFRPDYKNLGILKTQFPNVPLIALTATATQKVQVDLMEMLRFLNVREKSSVGKVVIEEIAGFIQEFYLNNESGIVYCFSRKECEQAGDVPRQSSMVFYENAGLQNLYDIVRYCLGCVTTVRSREIEEVDVSCMVLSCHAKIVVSMLQDIQQNDQRLTLLQLVDKMKTKHKELGSDLKREQVEQLIIKLILDRVLKEEFQHTAYATNAYLTTGPLANQILQGKRDVKLEVCSAQKKVAGINSAKHNVAFSGLELKLDELRKELSSIHGGIFPHSILSTQQISRISAHKPKSLEQLEKIIGRLKAEKYGERILEQIIIKYTDLDESKENHGSESRPSKRLKQRRL